MIKCLLASPPELLVHASAKALAYAKAQAYAKANLDHVLPVSPRAEVLRSDPSVGKHLALLPLNTLRMPTWVFSARDHRYGAYASAGYTVAQKPGAKFIGFANGAAFGGTQRRGDGGHRHAAAPTGMAMNNPIGSHQ